MNIKYFIHKNKTIISIIAIPILSMVFTHVTLAEAPLWSITAPFGDVDGSIHPTPHRGTDIALAEKNSYSINLRR